MKNKFKSEYSGKKVLILGLGQFPQGSGASAARFFSRAGARVTITDKKPAAELVRARKRLQGIKARFVFGGHDLSDVRRADIIIRNPGVRRDSAELVLARRLGKPVLNDIVVFLKNCPAQVIGVTGTRGKSTTSALVAEIFKAAGRRVWLGGNIKISPLSFAERVQADDLVVLELSSWMLEHFKEARPGLKVAVFTNLLRDHLNTYDSMADYFSAKKGIFAGQTSRDIAVISADNIWTKKLRRATKAKIIWTSLKSRPEKDAVFVRRGEIIAREQGKVTRAAAISDLALQGEHNLANALLAIGAGRALDAPWNAMKKALRTFKGLPDRQEAVRVWRGVSFINDTTATTPDATIAALRVFPSQKTVLITGGTDKKLFFGELAREALKVKALVLLPGSATDKLRPLLDRNNVSYADVRSMKEAVASAAKKARPGDRVLLSPGASSFGLFKNEFDRGEQFVREVKRLR